MITLSKHNQQRLQNFKANKRGYWSFWIFAVLCFVTLFAELIANDKPLIVKYDGAYYFPVVQKIREINYGGDFRTEADYRNAHVAQLINEKGWMLWPVIRYMNRISARKR